MIDWVNQILSSGEYSVTFFVAAFLLGLIGTFTSCCNFAVIGAVASYSGTAYADSKNVFAKSLFFFIGMIVSLSMVGAITGLASNIIGNAMGSYWKIAAGLLLIFFGLLTLNVLPFKMLSLNAGKIKTGTGLIGAFIFGLAIGGLSTGCNSVCNPIFPLILSAAFLKGNVISGIFLLMIFGIGYSLPFAAAMFGIGAGVGKLTASVSKIGKYLSYVAGLALIILGFYFLFTF